jgi:adenylate kinase family enzyme
MRLFIIGAAGSGKTTLSKELGNKLNIKPINLDDLFWNNALNAYGIRRNEVERDKMLDEEISKSSWIIEGAYISWPIKAMNHADRIIYINTPKNIINYRIWKRFINRKLGIEKRTKKETLKGIIDLIKWNNNQIIEIDKLITVLNKENHVEIIRNKRDIKQIKDKLL